MILLIRESFLKTLNFCLQVFDEDSCLVESKASGPKPLDFSIFLLVANILSVERFLVSDLLLERECGVISIVIVTTAWRKSQGRLGSSQWPSLR